MHGPIGLIPQYLSTSFLLRICLFEEKLFPEKGPWGCVHPVGLFYIGLWKGLSGRVTIMWCVEGVTDVLLLEVDVGLPIEVYKYPYHKEQSNCRITQGPVGIFRTTVKHEMPVYQDPENQS